MAEEFLNDAQREELVRAYLGKTVHICIDRPIGYVHRKERYALRYPINYGYIPDVFGGDGEELDVYLLGVDTPVAEYDAHIIAAVRRRNDVEDKLVGVPFGMELTAAEIKAAVAFQEQYYDSEIQTLKSSV